MIWARIRVSRGDTLETSKAETPAAATILPMFIVSLPEPGPSHLLGRRRDRGGIDQRYTGGGVGDSPFVTVVPKERRPTVSGSSPEVAIEIVRTPGYDIDTKARSKERHGILGREGGVA